MKILYAQCAVFISLSLLFAVVFVDTSTLPTGELESQWLWLAWTSMFFLLTTVSLFFCFKSNKQIDLFTQSICWILILYGAIQALYGLLQIYGYASSRHSLFALTGSFYNPGPYSGYLAMAFPVCLNEWLRLKNDKRQSYIQKGGYYLSGGALLLIFCILPAGMSRSAWIAAILSGLWVLGMHYSWGRKLRIWWKEHKKSVISFSMLVIGVLIVIGTALFQMKKHSADGRLFMWKISCLAIAKKPLTGYGLNGFAHAYGKAQEDYFAQGKYVQQEELVAGSPEFAFNEYLQTAIEWGIPITLGILMLIGFCLWKGITRKQYSICGALISLLIFSFSSYPLRLPTFFIVFLFLLAACVVDSSRVELAIFAIIIGGLGVTLWRKNVYKSCKQWNDAKLLYHAGAYEAAQKEYSILYSDLKQKGVFLFEYGHCLHKLKEYEASNKILQEAVLHNCDPMILNILGKNYWQMKQYDIAENHFVRSTHLLPNRIYPYYLLAKLYEDGNWSDKAKKMASIVLTKEPKVQSTAIREMRLEMTKIQENSFHKE